MCLPVVAELMPLLTACFALLLAGADGTHNPAALQGLWQSSSWQPRCSTLMACMHPLATRARLALAAQAACHWGCPLTWWGTTLPTWLHLPSPDILLQQLVPATTWTDNPAIMLHRPLASHSTVICHVAGSGAAQWLLPNVPDRGGIQAVHCLLPCSGGPLSTARMGLCAGSPAGQRQTAVLHCPSGASDAGRA